MSTTISVCKDERYWKKQQLDEEMPQIRHFHFFNRYQRDNHFTAYCVFGRSLQIITPQDNRPGVCYNSGLENKMEFAALDDVKEIMDMYGRVVEKVNTTSVRLGWNTDTYPDVSFVKNAIANSEMCILREDGRIIAAAVVNHEVNLEYDAIDWEIKGPKEKIATIHAFAVSPDKQGSRVSFAMLADIEDHCRANGDLAIHLDVIDTNIPAYKLYTRNGYTEKACIQMYYEVVGNREFWMMEHVL